ncbi:hypothetical protein Cni_G05045 [Canna indica]|uniref:EF-hand domain-containing protein n=1 Tax=Canna indica TaxID=4628 RepID=A0AAQ3Q3C3_9LILI|nr:hypothetical protein Cni_G05045 [Canna indica]
MVDWSSSSSALSLMAIERDLLDALGDALFGGSDEMDANADAEAGDEVEEHMREAFRVFNEDGDELILAVELQAVLTKLGLPEGRRQGG